MERANNSIVLLPHNDIVYDQLIKKLEQTDLICVISATGTGKSYIVAKLIQEHFANKTLILVPTIAIESQWMELVGKTADIETYAKFSKRLKNFEDHYFYDYELIACDEMHHLGSNVWGEAFCYLKENTPAKIIGLSATPIRYLDNARDMAEELFEGNYVNGYSLSEAINNGILPTFQYVTACFQLEEKIKELKNRINQQQLSKRKRDLCIKLISRLELSYKNKLMIKTIIGKHMPEGKRKIIVFINSIDEFEGVKKSCEDWFEQTSIHVIHSKQNRNLNNANIARFEQDNAKISVLLAIDMLNEGVHTKADTIIMFRKTESPAVYFQQLGRALSVKNEGEIVIFDMVGNHCNLNVHVGIENEVANLNQQIKDPLKQIIVHDYVMETMEVLNQIEKTLSNDWTEDEDKILYQNYEQMGGRVSKLLENRTASACAARANYLGLHRPDTYWTKDEDEIIRKYYPTMGRKVSQLLKNRNERACLSRAYILGVQYNSNTWTEEEDQILKNNYGKLGGEVAKLLPNRSRQACLLRASLLDLKRDNAWTKEEISVLTRFYPTMGKAVYKKIPGKSERACITKAANMKLKGPSSRWTKKEDDILRKHYPAMGKKVHELLPKRSEKAIAARAKFLNIRKDGNWTEAEMNVLIKNYPTMGLAVSELLPGRSKEACKSMALKLKIKRTDRTWTEEENRIMLTYYPELKTHITSLLPKRSKSACIQQAKKLGLT